MGAKAPAFFIRTFGVVAATALLAGCQGSTLFSGGSAPTGGEATRAATASTGVQRIDRDIEAPDIYQATDDALWDGRPSLGGVWVAAPDVTDPERVLIRNAENGKTVVGALFKRERDNPGPVMQLSSDAAVALSVLAGAPTQIEVVALRREEVEEPAAPAVVLPETGEALLPEAEAAPAALPEIEATTLDGATDAEGATDVLAAATAAVEAAEAAPAAAPVADAIVPTPAVAEAETPTAIVPVAAPAPTAEDAGPPDEAYVQVGLFSLEANAMDTAAQLSKAGLLSTILSQNSGDKTVWRVVVGPADTRADRSAFIRKAWDMGFTDAYPVEG